ncbi:MAG TPA: TIGR02444 family protein [Brevundimonas sp.]|jgi:uncharacterized protein (TIGR02444 family)|uniref:TIGR02444 family protein n=1 Tax=Brevundimonas sp. TaxID=1871086 RepID=UPI002DE6AEF7|nr:TIGR02444 family protein [Brevundimonas sp.]
MSDAAALWAWAVDAYGRGGVSETCLSLQDRDEQNVPLLLFGAWCALTGRRLDDEAVDAACDVARVWDEKAVGPLRAVRRALKAPLIDMDAGAREEVRRQVKAVELEAERRLLEALAGLAGPAGAVRDPLPDLARLSRQWGGPLPRPALARLAERLIA